MHFVLTIQPGSTVLYRGGKTRWSVVEILDRYGTGDAMCHLVNPQSNRFKFAEISDLKLVVSIRKEGYHGSFGIAVVED